MLCAKRNGYGMLMEKYFVYDKGMLGRAAYFVFNLSYSISFIYASKTLKWDAGISN